MLLRIFVLLVFSAIASAQNLRVTAGAVDDQVFQRDANGSASIRLSGAADAADGKAVEARLSRKAIALTGWDQVATISGGHWSGEVRNVPTGGPYRVEFRIPGTNAATAVNDLLVGDLWVLAGQSNMEGVGDLVDTEMPNELVHNFDMADNWMVAEDPLHSLPGAADRVHWRRNANREPERLEGQALRDFIRARKKGAGLGLPFAVEMVRRTSVPIGLLSCAHGGTSMDQWDPALKDKEGDSLYGSMVRRFRAAGGRVTGLLWYQGESDANPKAAPEFQQKFERFVARVREDFGQPGLPFYYVQIGRHVNDQNQAEWNLVARNSEIRRNLPAAFPLVLMPQNQHGQAVESETPDDTKGISFTQHIDVSSTGENREQLEEDHQIDDAVRGSKSWMRPPEPVGEHSIFRDAVKDSIGSNDRGIYCS